jgi:hypothetical protein
MWKFEICEGYKTWRPRGCVGYLDRANECRKWNSKWWSYKELVKVLGQQMSVTNFVHKNWYVFCSKSEIIVKMNYTI